MKNLATLALLGVTSAHYRHHEMQKKFGKPDETDKNESFGHTGHQEFGKQRFGGEITDADIDAGLDEVEYTPQLVYTAEEAEALCSGFVQDFANQPDWWLLGPKGGVTKLDIT